MADENPDPEQHRRPKRKRETIPNSAEGLKKYEQTIEAMRLRKKGYQWREIGKAMGIPPTTLFDRVQKYLRTRITEEGDDLRTIELERLDDLEKKLTKILDGGGRGAPRCAEVILKIHERRAALLGLDAPEELNLNAGPTVLEYFRDPNQDKRKAQVDAVLATVERRAVEERTDLLAQTDTAAGRADPGADE